MSNPESSFQSIFEEHSDEELKEIQEKEDKIKADPGLKTLQGLVRKQSNAAAQIPHSDKEK